MRNIGAVSRRWLREIDVRTLEDLRRVGAIRAFRMIRELHPDVTLNLLWALDGAEHDMDWRNVPSDRKARLKRELGG